MSKLRVYRIIRSYSDADRPNKTIKRHLTLAEARAHCRRDDTKGKGWFDGYDLMKGLKS